MYRRLYEGGTGFRLISCFGSKEAQITEALPDMEIMMSNFQIRLAIGRPDHLSASVVGA